MINDVTDLKVRNDNGKGTIWYGMHFYPGVAQYNPPGKESFRVYVNEKTIRKMDPTFAGRPVFVSHVDEVEGNNDELRKEADGWVVKSFYNEADGKHWVQFIIVSKRGQAAIAQGMKLSNAYELKSSAGGGEWNGVDYEKQIMDAEYEHLALVKNPRYDESVIMSPDQFKKYNADHLGELKRLANSKESTVLKNIFKRTKVDAADLTDVVVELDSGRNVSFDELVKIANSKVANDTPNLDPGGVASLAKAFGKNEEEPKKEDEKKPFAHPEHMVKMKDGSMCNVMELAEKHDKLKDELEAMKAPKEKEVEAKEEPKKEEPKKENAEDDKEKKLAPEKKDEAAIEEEKAKNELEAMDKRREEIKARVARLRSAPDREISRIVNGGAEQRPIELMSDQVERGKQRYGSAK